MSTSTTAALYAATVSLSPNVGAVPEDSKSLKHHLKDGKGFHNPWESWRDQSAPTILKAMAGRRIKGTANVPDTTPPTVNVRRPKLLTSREVKTLRATWLGHACYYVEFPGGFRALFDPVFSERCSPFSWLGPKRYTPIPCQIEDLPFVDAVIISHNHYDHLDHSTIMKIKAKYPNVHFFVPLKNKKWFSDCGIQDCTELDWWEQRDVKLSSQTSKSQVSLKGETEDSDASASILASVSCFPCQHISARTPFDKAHTLWASWGVESGGKKVWFGGDTGYRAVPEVAKGVDDYGQEFKELPHCPAFKQIGELRGPWDLGLIPIGAYEPRFIMSSMHANPYDAVNIFKDTKCARAMGIHWGTWVLTEEDVLEPPKQLKAALTKSGIPATGVFDICEIGESREFA
ncbi:hypothetical protein MMC25_007400 [Agyrium rufum]|nr:hypothetical protein [Agyrium rufum]